MYSPTHKGHNDLTSSYRYRTSLCNQHRLTIYQRVAPVQFSKKNYISQHGLTTAMQHLYNLFNIYVSFDFKKQI